MAAIKVKRYHSGQTGIPQLTGVAGTLITLLDAVLVDGFNVTAPTGATRSGTTATLSFGSAHGYGVDDVILLSGATGSGDDLLWNDEFRVLTASTNSLTFTVPAAATTPAAGTLACKNASLGWTKPFSGTNKAAYLNQAAYVRHYLRVQDDASTPTSAAGRWAKTRVYETMSDVDTGTGPMPTVAQSTNGLSLLKSSTSDSTTRAFWVAGDGGIFYMGTFWHATYPTTASGYAFGDLNSLRAGDAYSYFMSADLAASDTIPSSQGNKNLFGSIATTLAGTQDGKFLSRTYNQIGSSVACAAWGMSGIASNIGGVGGMAYPHPPDSGLLFCPLSVTESSTFRTKALPGIYQPLHVTPLAYLDKETTVPDLPGRTLQAFDLAAGTARGQCLIDITGPWR
jgi:hypothetical protein